MDNDFVWDDVYMFVDNDGIWQVENMDDVFVHNSMWIVDGGTYASYSDVDTYRPVTLLTFMIDGAWGGRRPLPLHFTNMLLHILAMWLGFLLVVRVVGPRAQVVGAVVVALWAVHPQLSEAHVWINGRSDVLTTVFGLAGVLLWLPDHQGNAPSLARTAASAPLFALALLSKETIAMVMPLLVLYDAGVIDGSMSWERIKRAAMRAIPIVVGVAAYIGLRLNALSGARVSGETAPLSDAILRVPVYLIDGIVHLFVPYENSVRFMMEEYQVLPTWVFIGGWVVAVIGFAVLWWYRRRSPAVFFGLLWYVFALAPATLISLLEWYGFGRYLYLPGIGFAIALTAVIVKLPPSNVRVRAGIAISAMTFIVFGALYLQATEDWADQESFYQGIIRDHPNQTHGHRGLGLYYFWEGRYEESAQALGPVVEIDPDDTRYWNELAQAHYWAGDYESAYEVASEAWQLFPAWAMFPHVVALTQIDQDPHATMYALVYALYVQPTYLDSRDLIYWLISEHDNAAAFEASLDELLQYPEYENVRAVLGR